VTGPADDDPATAVDALLTAGQVPEAAELVEVALLGGLLAGTAGAHVRLKVASALVMNGAATDALRHADAVLMETGLDDEVYSSAQLTRLMALMAHDEFASTRAPAVAILGATTSPDDDASVAAALTTMGSVAWTEGRVADSIMLLRAAVTRSRRGRFADRAMHPGRVSRCHSSPWASSPRPRRSCARIKTTSVRATTPGAGGESFAFGGRDMPRRIRRRVGRV
jgi:hypothetical protein